MIPACHAAGRGRIRVDRVNGRPLRRLVFVPYDKADAVAGYTVKVGRPPRGPSRSAAADGRTGALRRVGRRGRARAEARGRRRGAEARLHQARRPRVTRVRPDDGANIAKLLNLGWTPPPNLRTPAAGPVGPGSGRDLGVTIGGTRGVGHATRVGARAGRPRRAPGGDVRGSGREARDAPRRAGGEPRDAAADFLRRIAAGETCKAPAPNAVPF